MRFIKFFVLTALLLSAISTRSVAEEECFEGPSRAMFSFNMAFDRAILKPIAKGYNKLPEPIRKGTGNFTSNIATLLSIPNHLLQGNLKGAGDASASFAINTTVGILGFGNPAAALGFENAKEDVGQTLGAYGIKHGCYFVLPILGPTSVRDSVGMFADTFVDPFSIVTWREKELFSSSGNKIDYIAVKGTSAVDYRGSNMKNFDSLEKNSLDMYSSMKSVYLQDRERKVNNSSDSDDEDWGNLDK
tara:strand:- start:550 stop:1287 length:738 start_codon:yes stop_codon:yes gene_type:complete